MAENDTKTTALKAEIPVGKGELVAVPPTAHAEITPIIPRTVEELKYMANLIVQAGLAPDSYERSPTKVALGIMKALEVGLPPLTGLANIMIVNNRATIWGDAAMALVQSKGVIDKLQVDEIGEAPKDNGDKPVETAQFKDSYGFRVSIWRKGQDAAYQGAFTVADAKRAHLWMNPRKAPWMQHPKRMLRIRATTFAVRDGFADCLSGLAIREEVEDMPAPVAQADTSFLDDLPTRGTAALELGVVDEGGEKLTGLEGG